jgi:hypothetical protein
MMPLTSKGREILAGMEKTYGPEKAKQVLYASKNKGTITGIDTANWMDAFTDEDILETCAALERGDASAGYWVLLYDKKHRHFSNIDEANKLARELRAAGKSATVRAAENVRDDERSVVGAKLDALCDAAENLENRAERAAEYSKAAAR